MLGSKNTLQLIVSLHNPIPLKILSANTTCPVPSLFSSYIGVTYCSCMYYRQLFEYLARLWQTPGMRGCGGCRMDRRMQPQTVIVFFSCQIVNLQWLLVLKLNNVQLVKHRFLYYFMHFLRFWEPGGSIDCRPGLADSLGGGGGWAARCGRWSSTWSSSCWTLWKKCTALERGWCVAFCLTWGQG